MINHKQGLAMLLRRSLLPMFTIAALAFAGCSDSEPTAPDNSFKAGGVAIRIGGADTVVADTNSTITGKLSVIEGGTTDSLGIIFILSDGSRSVPTDAGYTMTATVANPALATITLLGAWGFRLQGLKAGETSVMVKLMKGSTTIYTSPAIALTVIALPSGLNAGDTLTYTYYDRDTLNMRIEASKQIRRQYILRSDLTLFGRSNVSEALEIQYDATGTVEMGRDTIYLAMEENGSVYQYDLLRDLLPRIDGGILFADAIDPQWIKINDTKASVGAMWSPIEGDSIVLKNITLQNVPFPVDVTFRMIPNHRGVQPLQVPGGNYTDNVRTEHSLRVRVALSGAIPIPVLNDSLTATFNVSPSIGIVSTVLASKTLRASFAGQEVEQPVRGYESELTVVQRKP